MWFPEKRCAVLRPCTGEDTERFLWPLGWYFRGPARALNFGHASTGQLGWFPTGHQPTRPCHLPPMRNLRQRAWARPLVCVGHRPGRTHASPPDGPSGVPSDRAHSDRIPAGCTCTGVPVASVPVLNGFGRNLWPGADLQGTQAVSDNPNLPKPPHTLRHHPGHMGGRKAAPPIQATS